MKKYMLCVASLAILFFGVMAMASDGEENDDCISTEEFRLRSIELSEMTEKDCEQHCVNRIEVDAYDLCYLRSREDLHRQLNEASDRWLRLLGAFGKVKTFGPELKRLQDEARKNYEAAVEALDYDEGIVCGDGGPVG